MTTTHLLNISKRKKSSCILYSHIAGKNDTTTRIKHTNTKILNRYIKNVIKK